MKDNAAYIHDDGDHVDFSTVNLEEEKVEKKKKVPRRVLHFSDGVVEEYSTDSEDEVDAASNPQPVIDPRTLTWGPWVWNRLVTTSVRTLAAIDFCGEKLAGFFGILDSRYQYAIDEYHKNKREEEEEERMAKLEQEAIRLRELRKAEEMESGDPAVKIISTGEITSINRSQPDQRDEPCEQI